MTSGKTIDELSGALAIRKLTSQSQLRQLFDNISTENPARRIFTHTLEDAAQDAACESDQRRQTQQTLSALDGIPVAIKDNMHIVGCPTTAGSHYDFSHLFGEDAAVVKRLRKAGAVIAGKLNMDEGALGATTRNPFWGQCDNPHLPGMTPGGSSGGSAAAIAAGWLPLTLGSDTLGSVRIPAAYCGVWGIKPTRGLISSRGIVSLSTTLDCIGPLANCAEDLATAVELLAGKDADDPESIEPPAHWHVNVNHNESLEGVQLGVLDWHAQVECEEPVVKQFTAMLNAASQAGAQVTSVTLDAWQATQARRAGFLIAEAECARWLHPIMKQHDGAFSDNFKSMIEYGANASAEKLALAYVYIDALKHDITQALDSIDVLITPTVPQQAFPQTGPVPVNQADFTALANFASCPAVAFPINNNEYPVPVSAQVMGPAFSESKVLSVAQLLSELTPR